MADQQSALTRPVYSYTSSQFANAPEAISRVVSEQRLANHEIAVKIMLGVCSGPPGRHAHTATHTIIVADAGRPEFARGSFVMTGGVNKNDRVISVIRHVSAQELRRVGCKP